MRYLALPIVALGAFACAKPGQPVPLIAPFDRGSARVAYRGDTTMVDSTLGRLQVHLDCYGQWNEYNAKIILFKYDSAGRYASIADPPLGDYSADNVPPGRYRLLSRQLGCAANQAWIEIRPSKVTEVWVRLDRVPVAVNDLSL